MPGHDLIVVGGSAGGLEALTRLVAGLPADLPAAVCVVLHLRAYAESHLANVLARAGPLAAVAAHHDMALRPGVIHVAVPDLHLLIERDGGGGHGVLRLTRGPKENRARPAVDPLFRSAALAYGARAIAVLLSGALDDGTAGLWAIRDRGGIVVVQDPDDALVSSMPASALAEVGADHVVPAAAIGPLLGQLARAPARSSGPSGRGPHRESDTLATTTTGATDPGGDPGTELEREVAMSAVEEEVHLRSERYGVPSRFACPDCGGVLWTVGGAGPPRFRCETGHAYSPESLAEAQTEANEQALWAALRAMEDRIELARLRAERARERGLSSIAQQFTVQEEAAQQHAVVLRSLLRLDGRTGIRPMAEPQAGDDEPRREVAGARGRARASGDRGSAD